MDDNILPKRNIPRDLFLHLLVIVTLYWSAINFVTLLWQYINYFFQDALNNFYFTSFTGPIRFAVASLIIVFPVFILVSWYLNKIYKKESQVRESKIRKWLIYLTLFIASIVIIGDLVSVINTFLGGEITVRFILKAFSILAVAAVIFGYYLDDVRKESPTKSAKYFAWAASLVILISVIGAFFIIGSPNTARLIQFDQQKIYDLQNIQSQIVNYWQRKGAIPSSLDYLNDPISSYKIPVDPQSGMAYEYSVKDAVGLDFELCAVFNKETKTLEGSIMSNAPVPARSINYDYPPSWDHASGRVCFERTIDKQLYPPFSTTK